jgi:hypothetical protein
MIVSGDRSLLNRRREATVASDRKTVLGGLPEERFFTSAEKARPLPLAYGQFQVGSVAITPIWDQRAVKQGGGKGEKKGGGDSAVYKYSGSFAVAFCHGALDELTELRTADATIWKGPLTRNTGNANGIEIETTLGPALLFWGTDSQTDTLPGGLDPTSLAWKRWAFLWLMTWFFNLGTPPVPPSEGIAGEQAAMRGTCYIVFLLADFGYSPAPPQITLIGKRRLSLLSISTHSLSGDAVLPEVLYDIFTNARYGAKLAADKINKASFEAAAEVIIAEDLGASPVITEANNLRDAVSRLLTYMRGVCYYDGGKLVLKLLRDDPAEVAIEIGPDDLLDPPEPEPGDWSATWAQTRVTFTNTTNDWERDAIAYTDPANAKVRGHIVPQDIEREWMTRQSVAKAEAARVGTLNGIPLATYPGLRLLPKHRGIRPGRLLKLVYPKLNIAAAYLRAESVTVGGPNDPSVTVDAIEDPARQTTLGYVPAGSDIGFPGSLRFPLIAPTVRVATLTTDLKEGSADGLLVACSRPTGLCVRHETWFTWDPAQASYGRLAAGTAFPIFGTVLWWMRQGTGWILRFKIAGAFDTPLMAGISESFQDHFFVMGRRAVRTAPASDTHALLCVLAKRKLGGRFAAISTDTFDIEVDGAQRGTTDLALETTGAAASMPTGMAYFGQIDAFTLLRSDTLAFDRAQGNDPADSQRRRYIKTVVGDDQAILELGDVSAVEFKRSDTSMDPAGSYSPTWGSKAKTAYEVADDEWGLQYAATPGADYANVTDLDEALGKVYEGTATAADTALLASLDDVLGAYLGNANGIYNDTP